MTGHTHIDVTQAALLAAQSAGLFAKAVVTYCDSKVNHLLSGPDVVGMAYPIIHSFFTHDDGTDLHVKSELCLAAWGCLSTDVLGKQMRNTDHDKQLGIARDILEQGLLAVTDGLDAIQEHRAAPTFRAALQLQRDGRNEPGSSSGPAGRRRIG